MISTPSASNELHAAGRSPTGAKAVALNTSALKALTLATSETLHRVRTSARVLSNPKLWLQRRREGVRLLKKRGLKRDNF